MDKKQRDELREKCEKATPGPWKLEYGDIFSFSDRTLHKYPPVIYGEGRWENDLKFVAAATPLTIR